MINVNDIPYPWLRKELTLDKTYSRGATGNMVVVIQEWLKLNGWSPVIDGDFGPATEQYVHRFQASVGLSETGTVDQSTFEALIAPALRALTPIPASFGSLGDAVVSYANQHLAEHPREVGGENCGPWVRIYTGGYQGTSYPWCAAFVSFVVKQAADALQVAPPIDYTLSCDLLATNGQRQELFIGEDTLAIEHAYQQTLRPGSIFLVRRAAEDWTHTGIVVSADRETFETIEGNTNDKGDREGYEVCHRIRGYRSKDFVLLEA